MKSLLAKTVVLIAKLCMKMPVSPFGSVLGKMYYRFMRSEHIIVREKVEGITFELDLREAIDNAMFFMGSREPETSRALKLLCKNGDVVIDIGANIGSHTLPIASFVGEEGRVYAFEPVPWAMNKMKRNIELNSFGNIVPESIGLSDVNEDVEMKFRASFKIGSKSGVGKEGEIDDSWWRECEHVKVRMETLDHYVASHKLDRIDLIKLDVDGFEGKVIRGALESLKRFSPILIMEVAPAWTEMRGDNIKDILYEIELLGYKFYHEIDFKEINNLTELIDALPPGGGFNILASLKKII